MKTIVQAFEHFRAKEGSPWSAWCVGVTDDPSRKLFGEHKVLENQGQFICLPADTNGVALEVKKYFQSLGALGGGGGGDLGLPFVYAYLITSATRP